MASDRLAELELDGPLEPFRRLGTRLVDGGDLWGELVLLDCEIERVGLEKGDASALGDDRARFLRAHGPAICSLQAWLHARVTYRRGFVTTASFGNCRARSDRAIAQKLNELLWLPASRFLATVSFKDSHLGDERASILFGEQRGLSNKHLDLRGNGFSSAIAGRLERTFRTVSPETERPTASTSTSPAPWPAVRRPLLRLKHDVRPLDDADD